MKALIQNYRRGELTGAEIPAPSLRPGGILVQNAASLVSSGTERLMMEFARKSLPAKAWSRPDLVRQVWGKVQRDGFFSAAEIVGHRLDDPVPMGYSSAGTIISVGEGVENFRRGDRVACAGAGYATHAQVVCVPKNLAVRLPEAVDFESGAFAALGAVALQGLRLAGVQLGETVVVIGLGLVGFLAAQLAKSAGCRVLGMDPDRARLALARQMGMDEGATDEEGLRSKVRSFSGGRGADSILITASTHSNEPVRLAAEVARDRAVVVAVGAVGMEVPRKSYYEKELTLCISRSYGPGRYDPQYEEKGQDYPLGHVRWTENRNMEAFIRQLADGRVNVKPLVTHRFPHEEARKAYDLLLGKSKEPFFGVLLTYPGQPDLSGRISFPGQENLADPQNGSTRGKFGLLGAGSFASTVLLPAIRKTSGLEPISVCSASGLSAWHLAKKFGFRSATTDETEVLLHPEVDTVVIATRHHLHARQVIAALKAGKHVFCEKPLCLNETELKEIVGTYSSLLTPHSSRPLLMVGFNRRFAPTARRLKEFLSSIQEPLVMNYRVNAGYIPPDHWVHDPDQGGGRILGEVCHFIDSLIFLAGALPRRVFAQAMPNNGQYRNDNLAVTLEFTNGSLGTLTYVANGDKAFPKERLEVFGGGAAAVLDNFRTLELVKNGCRQKFRSWKQDKGHRGEWQAFAASLRGTSPPPIPFAEMVATSRTTFRIMEALTDSLPCPTAGEEYSPDVLPSRTP